MAATFTPYPAPSSQRWAGLPASTRTLLEQVQRDAPGATMRHRVETPGEHLPLCRWCTDLWINPAAVTITGAPSGEYRCCTDHVTDIVEWVAVDGVSPDRLTVDVTLTPHQAHGRPWAS